MNSKKKSLFSSAMTYGLYLGIVMIIFSLLTYLLNIRPVGIAAPMLLGLASLVIVFLGIFFSTKKVRNEVLAGEMTFGQGFWVGVLVVFFASIISAVYSYVQMTIIDPGYMQSILEAQKEWMYEYMSGKGAPEEAIEKAMEGIEAQMGEINPWKTARNTIVQGTLLGAIVSLITAAILKKKRSNPFDSVQVVE